MKKTTSNLPATRPVPQRTCIICRQIKSKKEMVRLVRTLESQIEIDITGKREGRGAYLCRDRACWEKLPKSKQPGKALKCEISRADLEQLADNGKKLLKE